MKRMKNIPALIALLCFTVVLTVRAVSPPPDGGYPGGNTAEGQNSLFSLTGGGYNTGVGYFSLRSDATGSFNTAIGAGTLLLNTADNNTATGTGALLSNTTGDVNTANGAFALFTNTDGIDNTAIGFQALFSNVGVADPDHLGSYNTANGSYALNFNTTGDSNTAIGDSALYSNTTGGGNTAIGASALVSQITGNQNIVMGYAAGQNLTTGGVNIYISNPGVATENHTIRIGNVVSWTDIYGFFHPAHTATYIAGINGATTAGGVAVYVNSDGQLGTMTSSARFKTDFSPMNRASEAILALKPVSFRYKKEFDPKGIPQFGLIAEEVEKVDPDLVARDREGKPYSVRYEAVNAMLLNEFLKEHRKVEQQDKKLREQQATIADLKSGMQALIATVKEQASQIQKVSAELELQKRSARTVASKP
jgi:hypothetical protein